MTLEDINKFKTCSSTPKMIIQSHFFILMFVDLFFLLCKNHNNLPLKIADTIGPLLG